MALVEMDFINGSGSGVQVDTGTCTTTPTVICTSKNFTALTGENGIYIVSGLVVKDGVIVWQMNDTAVPISYNTSTNEVSVSWNGSYPRHYYVVMYE